MRRYGKLETQKEKEKISGLLAPDLEDFDEEYDIIF